MTASCVAGEVVGLLGQERRRQVDADRPAAGLRAAQRRQQPGVRRGQRAAVRGQQGAHRLRAAAGRTDAADDRRAAAARSTASFHRRWDTELVDRLAREWEVPLDRRIGVLSGGERQKLATLLALGHRPDLLVMDEPASGLDPVARRQFMQAVLEIAADPGRTMLLLLAHRQRHRARGQPSVDPARGRGSSGRANSMRSRSPWSGCSCAPTATCRHNWRCPASCAA